MKISKRYWFLAIPVGVLIFFFLLRLFHSISLPGRIQKAREQIIESEEKTISNWREADYVSVEHSDEFEDAIREAVEQHEAVNSLNTTQRRALAMAVTQLIYAHHDGTWESYRTFRIPVSTKYVQFNEGLLKYEMSHLPDFNISSPADQLETYYRYAVISATMESGKPAFCTQCWEEIALKDLYLSVHNATRKSSPSILSYAATNSVFHTMLSSPRLTFRPSVEKLLETQRSVKIAFVSILIRGKQLEIPHPVHVSYYWSPQHRKWLPKEFVFGEQGNIIYYYF